MKFGIQWIVQGRVLYVIVCGNQNISELRGLIQVELDTMETQGTPPVHLIVDNTRLKVVYGSRKASTEALNQILKHPQVGWLVFIHPISALRQLIGRLVLRIARVQWQNSNA